VLVEYDRDGRVVDFGSLEVQAVYISGNVRRPFAAYMSNPGANANMDWSHESNYPRPDYVSSSRKRLAPQLLFKGGILHQWRKKMAVALDRSFFSTVPFLPTVPEADAEMAWLVYDLVPDTASGPLVLRHVETVYTNYPEALLGNGHIAPPKIDDFIRALQTGIYVDSEKE
jgi:hypothetical protein